MNIEAPTFNALNKPQKRALILRDQLRFLESHHLESFLEGVSDNEPLTYTKTNNAVESELALVTLKAEATYFDLGNVIFSENNNAVHRVYLVTENGQVQMRMDDPLPLDDNVLDSLPIHGFIARGMIPLFKEKFEAIQFRMTKINEARRVAYNMAHKTATSFREGETLTRPNLPKTKQIPTASPSKTPTKPKPDEEVKQHVSKRKRTKLDNIPEEAKNRTPDTIPEETKSILDTISSNIKVSLFDTIVNTAFPHFDNVINASRNIISIYSAGDTDLAAIRRSIIDLKRVLQEFDEVFGKRIARETPAKHRHDLEESSRNDKFGNQSICANSKNAEDIPRQSDSLNGSPPTFQKDRNKIKKNFGTTTTTTTTTTTPPRPLTQPPSTPSNQLRKSFLSPSDSDPDSVPHMNPHLPPSTSPRSPHLHSRDSRTTYTSITALHQESVLQFQSNTAADMRRPSSASGTQANFLSNSLLGVRKTAGGGGVAPVVNMLPYVRKQEEEEE